MPRNLKAAVIPKPAKRAAEYLMMAMMVFVGKRNEEYVAQMTRLYNQ